MLLAPLWADGPHGHGGGFGPFWFWLVIMFFFWFGGWRLFAGAFGRGHGQRREPHRRVERATPPDPALVTLRERFARGEIDRAEFEERRAILLGRQGPTERAGEGRPGEERREWPDLV